MHPVSTQPIDRFKLIDRDYDVLTYVSDANNLTGTCHVDQIAIHFAVPIITVRSSLFDLWNRRMIDWSLRDEDPITMSKHGARVLKSFLGLIRQSISSRTAPATNADRDVRELVGGI